MKQELQGGYVLKVNLQIKHKKLHIVGKRLLNNLSGTKK